MIKGKLEEIEVSLNPAGLPLSLTRSGRRFNIRSVYDHWRVVDGWWGDEVQRDYFRIETDHGLVYDIYRDMIAGSWYLTKMRD